MTLPSFSAFATHLPTATFDWPTVIVTSIATRSFRLSPKPSAFTDCPTFTSFGVSRLPSRMTRVLLSTSRVTTLPSLVLTWIEVAVTAVT